MAAKAYAKAIAQEIGPVLEWRVTNAPLARTKRYRRIHTYTQTEITQNATSSGNWAVPTVP